MARRLRSDSSDAALIATLARVNDSVQVSNASGSTGLGLVKYMKYVSGPPALTAPSGIVHRSEVCARAERLASCVVDYPMECEAANVYPSGGLLPLSCQMKTNTALRNAGIAALLLLALVVVHVLCVDGLHGRLLSLCRITDTEYAKGYSDLRFSQISVGDTREKVVEVIGEPLIKGRSRNNGEWWNYSRSPGSTHYLYRGLQLKDGVVVAKISHFYLD